MRSLSAKSAEARGVILSGAAAIFFGPLAGPRGHSGGESHGHQELSPRNKIEESLL
jgi:hypothetical protein